MAQSKVIKNNLLQVDTLLTANSIPTSAQSYNCNWSDYTFLLICATQYSNAEESILVPTFYFDITNVGTRVRIYNGIRDVIYDVYKNTNTSVYIAGSQAGTEALRIRIYGIKLD